MGYFNLKWFDNNFVSINASNDFNFVISWVVNTVFDIVGSELAAVGCPIGGLIGVTLCNDGNPGRIDEVMLSISAPNLCVCSNNEDDPEDIGSSSPAKNLLRSVLKIRLVRQLLHR